MMASFPRTETEPEYECPDCKDKELVLVQKKGEWVAMPCKCKEIKATRRMIKSSGLTEEQRTVTFGNYKPTAETMGMYTTAAGYIKEFPSIMASDAKNKGIWLSGTVGVGKTHLLLAITNNLLARKVPTIFVNTPELIGELLESQFDKENSLNSKIKTLQEAQVVVFDDIGKEKLTAWVRNQYYRILNQRYERRLPTLFSSNFTMDVVSEMLGDASASRIYGMTKDRQVFVEGPDFRLN